MKSRCHPVSAISCEVEIPAWPRLAIRATRIVSGLLSANICRKPSSPGMRGMGAGSSTTPPPMVTTGENCRMMNLSPGSKSAASGSFSRAVAAEPGASCFAPCSAISATVSMVLEWKWTLDRCFSARGAEASNRRRTSTRRVIENVVGGARVMPRDKSSVLTPARFKAVRCPAIAASAACPWT